jgi:hypothetical protein
LNGYIMNIFEEPTQVSAGTKIIIPVLRAFPKINRNIPRLFVRVLI